MAPLSPDELATIIGNLSVVEQHAKTLRKLLISSELTSALEVLPWHDKLNVAHALLSAAGVSLDRLRSCAKLIHTTTGMPKELLDLTEETAAHGFDA